MIRGPLAVNLASLAVALLAVFFFAGGRIFRAVMLEPLAAGRLAGPGCAGRGPGISGQKPQKSAIFSKNRENRPMGVAAQARAMFLSNNYVKNDMSVSRETLPNN